MMMTPSKRRAVLGGALAITVGAAAWLAYSDNDALVAPSVAGARPRSHALPVTPSMEVSRTMRWVRGVVKSDPGELFTVEEPSADMVAEAKPATPEVPPLPFSYAGKLIENGRLVVFLSQGEINLTTQVGDVIDRVWKVESIRPPTMTFTYLPLKSQLTLPIGESN